MRKSNKNMELVGLEPTASRVRFMRPGILSGGLHEKPVTAKQEMAMMPERWAVTN